VGAKQARIDDVEVYVGFAFVGTTTVDTGDSRPVQGLFGGKADGGIGSTVMGTVSIALRNRPVLSSRGFDAGLAFFGIPILG
jgi:hypothetical protein